MLLNCIKNPFIYFSLLLSLVSGCSVYTSKTQPEIPEQVKLAYQHALDSMKAGKHKQAIKQFNNITKTNPELSGPFTNLGMLYLKSNSLDQAEQALQKAVTLKPTNMIGYNYLGIVFRHQGRFTDAEKAYLKAIEIDSNYPYAHLNLGILYDLYKSDLSKAILHYQRYLSLSDDPDKMVEKWIVDIKRRDTAGNKTEENKG